MSFILGNADPFDVISTIDGLALELVYLAIIMVIFYAVVYMETRMIKFPKSLSNTFGTAASLFGLYVWVKFLIS
ncbi:hypothetical protein V1498_10085 [Peribacillus sp. SCS-26]|uniref:hypothetical protein n=1 Tax=Paraperibacillus marinus TaxID=3115295 RepID=UPI0039063258